MDRKEWIIELLHTELSLNGEKAKNKTPKPPQKKEVQIIDILTQSNKKIAEISDGHHSMKAFITRESLTLLQHHSKYVNKYFLLNLIEID